MVTITLTTAEIILIIIGFIVGFSIGGFLKGFLEEYGRNWKEIRRQRIWEKNIREKDKKKI